VRKFPELRAVMAKYNVSTKELAELIGVTAQSFYFKINGKVGFSLSECKKVYDYFVEKGEDTSIDKLFFS
jgi:DNA-binding XRE family transcriptional regulator